MRFMSWGSRGKEGMVLQICPPPRNWGSRKYLLGPPLCKGLAQAGPAGQLVCTRGVGVRSEPCTGADGPVGVPEVLGLDRAVSWRALLGVARVSSCRKQDLVRKKGGYSRQEVCAARVVQMPPLWGSDQWRRRLLRMLGKGDWWRRPRRR